MFILQAIYFFLPAYLANMAPVFVAKIFGTAYDYPLDCFLTFRGRRIFGDHKTWRGLVAGIFMAMVVAWILEIDLVLGFLMGTGALLGDAIKSFFKRQINIKPGGIWFPFDQLDFVVGGLLAVSLIQVPPVEVILTLILITPVLHWLTNVIGYKLKLKEHPW